MENFNPEMTAEEAMAELWGAVCPDCGPEDYEGILVEVLMQLAVEDDDD